MGLWGVAQWQCLFLHVYWDCEACVRSPGMRVPTHFDIYTAHAMRVRVLWIFEGSRPERLIVLFLQLKLIHLCLPATHPATTTYTHCATWVPFPYLVYATLIRFAHARSYIDTYLADSNIKLRRTHGDGSLSMIVTG
jgi:hypothetical protein